MQFVFQFANTEIEAMARFTQSTFASITLTSENKKDFEKWASSSSLTALECMNKLMGDGFKVSASWVTDQNAFCCSIIGTDVTKHHKDMVMTSWSDDLEEVILIGTYKHYVLCNGDEWPTRDAGQRWG